MSPRPKARRPVGRELARRRGRRARDRGRRAGRARRGSCTPARGGSRGSPRTRSRSRLAVHPLAPVGEALVQGRAVALEEPVVDGVADEDVVEAERVLAVQSERSDRTSCLPSRASRSASTLIGRTGSATSSRTAEPAKTRPITEAASITGPLLGLELVEAGREQGVDRRRDRDLGDFVCRDPAGVGPLDHALVDHHREQLLDEERVAVRGLDDPLADVLVDADPSPSRLSTIRDASSRESGSSESIVRVGPVRPCGRCSSSSCRARQRMNTGTSVVEATRCSIRSRNVASAQWMSSNDEDERAAARRAPRRSLRVPQKSSSSGNCLWRGRPPRRRARRHRPVGPDERAQASPPRRRSSRRRGSRRPARSDLGERPERDAAAVRAGSGRVSTCAGARRPRRRTHRSAGSCRRPPRPGP